LKIPVKILVAVPTMVAGKTGTALTTVLSRRGVPRSCIRTPAEVPLNDGKCITTVTGVMTSPVGLEGVDDC
jgi:hypothetical protein